MTLTDRQAAVLQFLRDYISERGYSPSVRDVAAWFGISPHGAERHLQALEQKGAIDRTARVARSIRLLDVDKSQPTTKTEKPGKLTN